MKPIDYAKAIGVAFRLLVVNVLIAIAVVLVSWLQSQVPASRIVVGK